MAAGCGSKVAAAHAIEGGGAAAGGSVPQAIRGETAQWVPPSAEQPLWASDPFFLNFLPRSWRPLVLHPQGATQRPRLECGLP